MLIETMNWYYLEVNTDKGAKYNEIHKEDCKFMPKKENRIFLGHFSNCEDALKKAGNHFPNGFHVCPRCCQTD